MTIARTQTIYSPRLGDDDATRLVARAAGGDQCSWTLVERFGGAVWRVSRAHRLSDADAADVAQCTLMRLVENLDQIKDPECLGAWLATTARRECLGVIRRTTRPVPYSEDLPQTPSDDPHPSDRLISQQASVALHAAVERLEAHHRVLLWMLFSEPSPSYEEIGTTLEVMRANATPELAIDSRSWIP
jgi:RNA polymerase sigma factor (sigma-70 family)